MSEEGETMVIQAQIYRDQLRVIQDTVNHIENQNGVYIDKSEREKKSVRR